MRVKAQKPVRIFMASLNWREEFRTSACLVEPTLQAALKHRAPCAKKGGVFEFELVLKRVHKAAQQAKRRIPSVRKRIKPAKSRKGAAAVINTPATPTPGGK